MFRMDCESRLQISDKDGRRHVLSFELFPSVMTHRFKFRYMRFAFYGLAALQIQYAWKNHQQNAIYDMSTRYLMVLRVPYEMVV